MKRLAIAAALALTGCATTRTVPVTCLTKAQYEELKAQLPPKVADQLNGNAEHDIRIIAGSAVRLRSYGEGLLGILSGCSGN